ncbi:two-component system response regulator [Leptolyngbya sp. 'hensonii']|uniref:response regulator n=1 Tax=Leptolyngbya sp. 'hensonii' TaxID=1922337 RepID=UPI000950304F|nr:response regulator [Leptolyngbya sp. 'hensonii']OLP17182.1 two-component system response regulator [Leptolyngbya sp. 'hensonii']
MQGKLSEIDIRSILQLIELGQRTGELFVESYGSQVSSVGVGSKEGRSLARVSRDQSWFVFFSNGQIIYAAEATGHLSRLKDHLRRYKLDSALDEIRASTIAATNAPEYGYLWALLENHLLTPAQGRTIVQSMVHETLFDLLTLHQGSFIFEIGSALAPQLMTLEIAPLVTQVIKEVQEWKKFYPQIQSPDQCPVISEAEQLRDQLPENVFLNLDRWIDGAKSIRQIARYLNRDILMVARAIHPYVQQGLVQLHYPGTGGAVVDATGKELVGSGLSFDQWQSSRVPRIVCIDDGVAICEAVESILNLHGYEAVGIADPLKALSLVFQLKPDVILCDIAMPELDGYEICGMLRRSTAFRQIPIVMLTGKDGFIDRVKARMVGATDYLTKPFGESELLMLVEKYAGLVDIASMKPANLLVETPEDELNIDMTKSTASTPST